MSEDNLLGLQLDEYRLEALLGRGGMARVYRGMDTHLNRYVAIKVIDPPHGNDEEYVRRFKIEAQAIARLDHPHVVRLYRYGEVNGMLYMAMQFIEGADLGFLLESFRLDGEFIPAEDVLRLVTEICQALDYVHAHGIIHRDIKPSNVMLTGDTARATLTDFGLALQTEIGTRGEIFGSPHYIAPEQAISSAHAVPQSDLYSVGVMLYEMFTGVLPFDAADPMDIAILQMSSPPPSPREIRPELSEEVEAVVLKALEKKPEDRYQSGRALALALERALRKQPEQVLPTNRSIPERVTIGLAANPLHMLPPIPAAMTPAKPPAKAEASTILPAQEALPQHASNMQPPVTKSALPPEPPKPTHNHSNPPAPYPIRESKKISPWILIGAFGLISLCLLTCLVVGGMVLLLRNGSQSETASQDKPKSWLDGLTGDRADANDFQLKLSRCEEAGCLVVENNGSVPFPLSGLTLEGESDSFSGKEWGVAALYPGQCVQVTSDEGWMERLPKNVDCEVTGKPIIHEEEDPFWESTFTVLYKNEEVSSCMKKSPRCEVVVPR